MILLEETMNIIEEEIKGIIQDLKIDKKDEQKK